MKIVSAYLGFVRALSAGRLGRIAVVLITSSFLTFLLVQVAMLAGIVTNAYVGLVVYLLLPGLFVLGLLLVPVAWRQRLRRTGLTSRELVRRTAGQDVVEPELTGAPVFRTVLILTLINVLFLGVATVRMLHFMDTPRFCGTACHSVMNPEWTTYQVSPHARVACVDCHVGEGIGALIDSKLNGTWQIISATFDLYERPIPTPVHQLRPARETCEQCHWPAKFYGSRLVTRVTYDDDEASTPTYTTLNLKIDAVAGGRTGVHWHIGPGTEVRYASVDDEREEMIRVSVQEGDGPPRTFTNADLTDPGADADTVRVMDCVDCHNRATHIYQDPERAVDEKIRRGEIDRELPYIRREAVAAVTGGYPSVTAAREGISAGLESFYRRNYPDSAAAWYGQIDEAADVLIDVWARNIHPEMNIRWSAYPSLLGHRGCFRCHGADLEDDAGGSISFDCTMCHSILADEAREPFTYLEAPPEKGRGRERHRQLRQEFLTSFVE